MRNRFVTFDAGDRRAMARGAAAGLGLMVLLGLRAGWVLARGVLDFRRTGQNVAAYVMGLDLLPWALVFTAVLAAAGVVAASFAGATTVPDGGTDHARPTRHGHAPAGRRRLAGG